MTQEANGGTKKSPCNGFTVVELLIVLGVIGVLMGLLLGAIQMSRAAMDRVSCLERLRSLTLGFSQLHDIDRNLPPGHRSFTHSDKKPLTGWTINLLPYLSFGQLQKESKAAFNIQPNPFIAPPHPLDKQVSYFACPSDSRVQQPQISEKTSNRIGLTSYLGVSGLKSGDRLGVLYQDSNTSFSNILDGLSNTILLGERPPSSDLQFGWWYAGTGMDFSGSGDLVLGVNEVNLLVNTSGSLCSPGNYTFGPSSFDNQCGMFHFWSPHANGANFAFCDGTVRFITYPGKTILLSLATRAGGESETAP